MGDRDEAKKALEELRVMFQASRGYPVYDAQVFLGLGENARAIEQLERAVADYPSTVFVLNPTFATRGVLVAEVVASQAGLPKGLHQRISDRRPR